MVGSGGGKGLMSAIRFAVVILMSLLGAATVAHAQAGRAPAQVKVDPAAERRIALVIGNSAYPRAPLDNPVNDATDIAAKLRNLGFEVIERTNLKTSQIGRTLREFRSRLAPGSVALIFYAGHGLQIKGENYLPTVDADIEGEEDVPNQALSVRQMLELLDESKTRLNLVFLDACRNNPFSRRFRSAGDGLAKVTAPSGTLISFATRPGSVAADGDGRNGLYTTHLLMAMGLANQPIEQALKRVVSGVKQASKGQQEPWMEGSIEGDFYFLPQTVALAPATAPAPDPARSQQEAIDRAVQEAIRRSNEQAAKERAELQASMERILQQALAKQNEKLEEARRARDGPGGNVAPPVPGPAQAGARPTTDLSAASTGAQSAGSRAIGDTWEYSLRDEQYNKSSRLTFRVTAASTGGNALEEILLDGKPAGEWVSDGRFAAVAIPSESGFMMSSHWTATPPRDLEIITPGVCSSIKCSLNLKEPTSERLTVAAGTFDAIRIDGYFQGSNVFRVGGTMSFWFARDSKRLLRQTSRVIDGPGGASRFKFHETLELTAIRNDIRPGAR